MSGFAPEWLTLREGADHRARNAGLLAALGKHFSTRDAVTVVDLGAGLGSNLRATAPALPARQHWVLVDHDPVLLAGACDAIASWADSVRPATAGLEVMKAGRSIRVEVRHAISPRTRAPSPRTRPISSPRRHCSISCRSNGSGVLPQHSPPRACRSTRCSTMTARMPGARRIRPTPPWSPRSIATRETTRASVQPPDRGRRTCLPSALRQRTIVSSARRAPGVLALTRPC